MAFSNRFNTRKTAQGGNLKKKKRKKKHFKICEKQQLLEIRCQSGPRSGAEAGDSWSRGHWSISAPTWAISLIFIHQDLFGERLQEGPASVKHVEDLCSGPRVCWEGASAPNWTIWLSANTQRNTPPLWHQHSVQVSAAGQQDIVAEECLTVALTFISENSVWCRHNMN